MTRFLSDILLPFPHSNEINVSDSSYSEDEEVEMKLKFSMRMKIESILIGTFAKL